MNAGGATLRKLTWRLRFKAWRKRFYEHLPYIRRKTYRRLQTEFVALREILLTLDAASHAQWHAIQPYSNIQAEEICLFVTFAPQAQLKSHVIDHLNALMNDGIAVTLIVNTEISPHEMKIPVELLDRLNGCFIRENVGFDFAAWAHAFLVLQPETCCQRLYLVNDSIVGPLDGTAYRQIIAGVRCSSADVVGLTENLKPRLHLQSFFLVFNKGVLHSNELGSFMRGVLNLPSKKLVIDCYETQLTEFLCSAGYRCEALFPNLSGHLGFDDETTRNWKKLRERGFPFVKASILKRFRDDPELIALIPARYAGS